MCEEGGPLLGGGNVPQTHGEAEKYDDPSRRPPGYGGGERHMHPREQKKGSERQGHQRGIIPSGELPVGDDHVIAPKRRERERDGQRGEDPGHG